MYEKIGIERGSVYLFNKDNELEAKAFLPPKQMDGAPSAITFTMGEGVIGRAAASKQALFVPDTSRDKSYVGGEGEKAKALLCVPLVDKDILIGVMNFSGEVNKVAFADSDYEFVRSVARSLVTTIKNIRMVEVIEEHNRTLERKVEERTAALKQKNEDIANMFSNMQLRAVHHRRRWPDPSRVCGVPGDHSRPRKSPTATSSTSCSSARP